MTRPACVLTLMLCGALLALFPVAASATDPTPSVTLTSNRSVYVAGQTATFTSKVVATNLDYVVDVQYPGSATWHVLCASYNVNSDIFTCDLGLYYNVKVRARLIDDKGTADTSDDVTEATANDTVPVRASIGTTYGGYIVKSGHYAVYGRGTSPTFVTSSQPAFPGHRCLRHQVQRKYARSWRTVKTSACQLEGSQGDVTWRWAGRHASGVGFRVRATFAGDPVNLPNAAAWVYFRFR